jgi:hypothetical protein
VQYLNNILEQDHRAIKRRVNAKQGFREFQADDNAAVFVERDEVKGGLADVDANGRAGAVLRLWTTMGAS